MSDVLEIKFSPKPEVHERRQKVMRLRWVQNLTIEQICQLLGEGERTIYRDLEAIRKANAEARKQKGLKQDTNTVVAQLQVNYAERQRNRWQEFHSHPKDTVLRRRLLDDIHKDEETHMKLLQSMGVIEKVADNLNLTSTTETWAQRVSRLKKERQDALKEADNPE